MKPPLTPIPVAGPFDTLGVDVIQYPTSYNGIQYAVVFVDYLTKWPEVFATSDQIAVTIAQLMVEQIICRHGVPGELLSAPALCSVRISSELPGVNTGISLLPDVWTDMIPNFQLMPATNKM